MRWKLAEIIIQMEFFYYTLLRVNAMDYIWIT